MTGSRRTFMAGVSATMATAVLPRSARAAYPERAIRLIVPFAAGGNADVVGRLIGEQIEKTLGQSVVVENRGGPAGASAPSSWPSPSPTDTRCWSARTGRSPSIRS